MKYIQTPVEVDAVQWTGINFSEIEAFVGRGNCHINETTGLVLFSKLGNNHATVGDFIVRGAAGEIYPQEERLFKLTHTPLEKK